MSMRVVNPEELGAPVGYSNGMLAEAGGRLLFVAGQVAWDASQRVVCEDFPGQFAQALDNVLAVVRQAGGRPEHVGRMTIYVTDVAEYTADLRGVGAAYRERMGRHYPAMSLVQVAALLEEGAKLEIEATAVIP